MARYPTYEEYAKKGNWVEGIRKCDELLARMPKDARLLTTKLQFLAAADLDITETLDRLGTLPLTQLEEIVPIEATVCDASKDIYPPPLSAGPIVAKLWDNAFKAATSGQYKLDLLSVRFSRAVVENRTQDAQQALIALKAFQPKDRPLYMAHAAYTQLLSTSKDDLSSKLALGLARKAVTERFDDDKALDVRVAGQIFAIQGSEKDLEGIKDRPFKESQHVYQALKISEPVQSAVNGVSVPVKVDPAQLPSREWLDSEVTILRDDFAKLAADSAAADVVLAFVSNAVRLLHTAVTSLDLQGRDRGAADACFLAVSGLVKLYADSNNTAYLLQASYLAEHLLKFNEHIHEARLVLTYLYMRTGLGSLAMRMFDSLQIKQVQFDTVGHTLFTRLSVTHPFRTLLASRDWYEPHERTHKALGIYPWHEDKLSEVEASILNHNQTGMIFDVHSLRDSLRTSFARRLILLDHRRISRLTGRASGKGNSDVGPRKVANWTITKDNRDFNATFDYGFNVESHLYGDGSIIVPGQKWLLHNLAIDTAWALATGKQTPLILDADQLSPAVAASRRDGTRDIEHVAGSIALSLIETILATKAGSSPSKETIDTVLTATNNLPIDTLISTPDPLAEYITDHYIYIDILRTIQASCKYIKTHAQHIPAEVAELQKVARAGVESLQKHTRDQVTALRASEVRARLMQDPLRDAMALFGDDGVTTFAESVVQSAKEGWEGVGKIDGTV